MWWACGKQSSNIIMMRTAKAFINIQTHFAYESVIYHKPNCKAWAMVLHMMDVAFDCSFD